MRSITFLFDFRGYWSVQSGLGMGGLSDSRVARTPSGVPYLPGRSVKGLFRDATWRLVLADVLSERDWIQLFGTSHHEQNRSKGGALDRTLYEMGSLSFSDAVPESLEEWAAAQRKAGRTRETPLLAPLFRHLASTAIGDEGRAKDRSLRVQEVTVPLELSCKVEELPNAEQKALTDWPEKLELAAGLIRGAGSSRHRGLGRVVVRRTNGR